jgi:hypothetical protein
MASVWVWLTPCKFRPSQGVASIEGFDDTHAPSAAAYVCAETFHWTQFQYPRVIHAVFMCAMHHAPCFF